MRPTKFASVVADTVVKRPDWPTFFRAVVKGVGTAFGSILVYGVAVWLIYRYLKRTTDDPATVMGAIRAGMTLRSQGLGVMSAAFEGAPDPDPHAPSNAVAAAAATAAHGGWT